MSRYLEHFPVPPPLRLTTGGEEEQLIADERDTFFGAVREELQLGQSRFNPFFEQVTRQLNVNDHHPTDSWIHILMFNGEQQIASVLDMRDDTNFHAVTFSAHALSVSAMRSVLDIQAAAKETLSTPRAEQ